MKTQTYRFLSISVLLSLILTLVPGANVYSAANPRASEPAYDALSGRVQTLSAGESAWPHRSPSLPALDVVSTAIAEQLPEMLAAPGRAQHVEFAGDPAGVSHNVAVQDDYAYIGERPSGPALPSPPLEPRQAAADMAEQLTSQSDGTWRTYTNANLVTDLAVEGDNVWAATDGGVVRWSAVDGSYVKYTSDDGLACNSVNAIAIDHAGHKWFGT